MDFFENAKVVSLKSAHDKYLTAEEDEESVTQHHNGSSSSAKWTVEFSGDFIRLKSCHNKYLTASNKHFLLGMTGCKVLQTLPERLDSSVEWEPIREKGALRLKTRYGQFLRANGGLPPWKNSVTHDVPHWTATQEWILWEVHVVEILEAQSEAPKMPQPNDNPFLQISFLKLDGSANYLAWSRSCMLYIKARKLQGYINGDKKKPNTSESTYSQWDSENSLVMAWLLNSMQSQISRQYLLLDTAEKIWNATHLTYSRIGNDAHIFETRSKVHSTKQGELTVSQYFSELNGLWQELDYYQDFQADCTRDAVKFHKMLDKERVYDFLAGLNLEYDQIRAQVLGRTPFPSLEEAYSYVQQEESRRGVMLYLAPIEKSGLTVSREQSKAHAFDKDHLVCNYCEKPRHTKETCWKLHGRPSRGRGRKRVGFSRDQVNMAEVGETSSATGSGETLSSDEI